MYIICFDQINPDSVPFPLPLPIFPSQFHVLCFKPTESTYCYLYVHGYGATYWRLSNLYHMGGGTGGGGD